MNLGILVTLAVFSHFCCNGHSLLLNSHLSRFENPSYGACGYLTLKTCHRLLFYPTTDATPLALHQPTAASTWWCGPRPRLGWVEMAVGLPEGPSYPGHSPTFFFAMLPPERPQEGSTQHLQIRSPVFTFSSLLPYSCPSSSPHSSSSPDER